MRISLILLACVLFAGPRTWGTDEPSAMNPNPRGFDSTVRGRAFGHRYSSQPHRSDSPLAEVPRWTDDASEPPISVREAIVIAGRKVDELVEVPDGYTRHVNYAWLRHWRNGSFPQGAWYWVVQFEWLRSDGQGPPRPVHQLSILVLMNGQAVTPRKQRLPPDESDLRADTIPEREADEP
jgi:hypothetical protein